MTPLEKSKELLAYIGWGPIAIDNGYVLADCDGIARSNVYDYLEGGWQETPNLYDPDSMGIAWDVIYRTVLDPRKSPGLFALYRDNEPIIQMSSRMVLSLYLDKCLSIWKTVSSHQEEQ